ncbi:replication initiation protein RepC [Rhizobium leguminosarum]|uniref:plasmid replication protein RepC n=1 Tax=Rhizobium leguminosarum TaxID=384 RepID=UPI001C96B54C|nr:plasmid replication protein RepC [Rhizobium leguminosarum]MBY5775476.1 replication initiation protein RepC [Rhizobium leguminosarum]
MPNTSVATPFGRRPMTLALLRRQIDASESGVRRATNKWKILRDVSEACRILGLKDRTLAVLNALLSFYPDNDLTEERALVVFPSNAQLSLRAHGIAGTTLRRHLARLVDAGLIHRHDSPNGKRYAHRSGDGEVEVAFGFSLAPLLARAEELADLADQVAKGKHLLKRTREALTICRRDVRKLIAAAMEEGLNGDWHAMEARYAALVAAIPRTPGQQDVDNALEAMTILRQEILNAMMKCAEAEKMVSSGGRIGYDIQNSKPDKLNDCKLDSDIVEQEDNAEPKHQGAQRLLNPVSLRMVLKACPQISDYGPGGQIMRWSDLRSAAMVVRSMLGVSPSAYQQACEFLGDENAAITIACVLERAEQIHSVGGYFRALIRKAAQGEFSPGSMVMALINSASGHVQTTGLASTQGPD